MMRAVAVVLAKAGAQPERRRALRARHDGRDERPARGTYRPHRARRDRGLHRRDRARPPEPAAPLPALRERARAARSRRAALRRPGAGRARRDAAGARRPGRRRARAGDRRRGARGGRGRAAALLPRLLPRAVDRRGAAAALPRGGRSRCRASWWGPSASTSAPRRRPWTPRSRPRSAPTSQSLCAEAAGEGLAEPQIMQSSGGLTDAGRAGEHAALTVLSGPAGGVGGALLVADLAGERDVACFDMGGTSCDVCLVSGGQRARDLRARDRRAPGRAARARHPHRRRGRRLDRLARRRRRAARGARLGGRRARARLLREGRRAPHRHRRQPAARPAASRRAAGRGGAARPRRRPSVRSRRSRPSSGSSCWPARRASCASPRRRCSRRCV